MPDSPGLSGQISTYGYFWRYSLACLATVRRVSTRHQGLHYPQPARAAVHHDIRWHVHASILHAPDLEVFSATRVGGEPRIDRPDRIAVPIHWQIGCGAKLPWVSDGPCSAIINAGA